MQQLQLLTQSAGRGGTKQLVAFHRWPTSLLSGQLRLLCRITEQGEVGESVTKAEAHGT